FPSPAPISVMLRRAYSFLAPDELDQMRQAAAEVAADMEAGQPSTFPPPSADADIPLALVSLDTEGETSPVWGVEPLMKQSILKKHCPRANEGMPVATSLP